MVKLKICMAQLYREALKPAMTSDSELVIPQYPSLFLL